ncbi:helix-turn-helix domain-containing protein [Nocardia sp. NPDC051570]|uniref:helix-turn-helix domain-containing protein n=1 Tax=Nocardia sp. NPDC051570 TaxID=3364324 RepID=UPI0037B9AB1C
MTAPHYRSPNSNQGARLDRYDRCVARSLQRLRQTCGLTVAELAEHIGYEQEWLNNVESGSHSPTIRQLHDLTVLYDVDGREFLERTWAETIGRG